MEVYAPNHRLAEMLASHPVFSRATRETLPDGVDIVSNARTRKVRMGLPSAQEYGLLELMDNNPIVCADEVSIPSLAASAFLIALGPLLLSGLIEDTPGFVTNMEVDDAELSRAAASVGWIGDLNLMRESVEAQGVGLATGMAVIRSIAHPEEIVELYRERFQKSLILREADLEEFQPELVSNRAVALYRVNVHPDDPSSLVTVQVMADRSGAFQAAQFLSVLNVMFGLQDELGLIDRLL